jgi:hypothetical protein
MKMKTDMQMDVQMEMEKVGTYDSPEGFIIFFSRHLLFMAISIRLSIKSSYCFPATFFFAFDTSILVYLVRSSFNNFFKAHNPFVKRKHILYVRWHNFQYPRQYISFGSSSP